MACLFGEPTNILQVATGLHYAREKSGGEQFDGRRRSEPAQINWRGLANLGGKRQTELNDRFRAVTVVVGRHQEQSRCPRRGGLPRQFHRSVQRRMRNIDDQGQAAALRREIHHVAAVIQREVDKLAGGTKQDDRGHSAFAQKVDQLQRGAQIDGVLVSAPGADGISQDTRKAGWCKTAQLE